MGRAWTPSSWASLSSPSRPPRYPGGLLLACGTLFICTATLWPFTFAFRPMDWRQFIGAFALEPSTLLDLPRNIILFVPFGMGVAWLLEGRGISRSLNLVLTGAAGLAMTLCVESLQVFLPGRTPNLSDVWSNVCGAIAGVALLHTAPRLFAWLRASARRGPVLAATVIVSANVKLAVTISLALMSGVVSQPFTVGPRPLVSAAGKEGTPPTAIRDVIVLNRAVDQHQQLQLLDGRLPAELVDAVVAGAAPERNPVANPARLDTSFTIALTLDPLGHAEGKRGPLLSVAGEDATDHVVIAQDETRMALRWRSRFDRGTAARTELEFPGVLDPTPRPRRVIVTVRGVTASVRTSDGAGNGDVLLGPEATLSALLREADYWPLTLRHVAFWRALITFAAIVFALPALLLGAVLGRHRALLAAACGIVLPALCSEAVVAFHGPHTLRVIAILTGAAVTAAGFAAGRLASRRFGLDARTELSPGPLPVMTSERRQSTA